MKKILLLLITTILLTSCTANYDIHIGKDTINDKITISTDSNNVNNPPKNITDKFTKKLGEWENGHDFYKREIVTTEDTTSYQYTYNFKYNEYDAMSQIRKCYNNFNLKYDNYISIYTSNEFLCKTYHPEINTMSINITSYYDITSSNADKVNGNTHTWIINNSNYKNKPINIKVNKNKVYIDKSKKENKNYTKEIIVSIIFVVLLAILLIRKKGIRIKKI